MKAQDLKNSILQMAVQGKLVPQDDTDEPACMLLEKIKAEKARMVREGTIKRSKDASRIYRGADGSYYEERNGDVRNIDDEISFEIPESWEWVRLGNIAQINPKNKLDDHLDVSFIPMRLIDGGYSNNHTFEIRKWGAVKKGYVHFQESDIGLAKITPCFENMKSVIFQDLINGYGAGTTELHIIRSDIDCVLPKYLLFFLKRKAFISDGVNHFFGTAGQQRISKDFLLDYLIPLPPFAEQHRIVAKIEQLSPIVDEYGKAEEELTALNNSFHAKLKQSILQNAVQGKLVPQDDTDEPACVLLEKIKAEKVRMVQEGKIKKSKDESRIYRGADGSYYEECNGDVRNIDDEIPFEIPESWEWVRLEVIGEIVGGGTPKTNIDEYWRGGTIPWLTPADMKDQSGKFVCHGKRFITRLGLEKSSAKIIPKGSLIFSSRAPIGYMAISANDLCTNQGFRSVCFFGKRCVDFMYYCIKSRTADIIKRASGTTFLEISGSEFGKTIVPLPPLNEQHRIVTKIEELFAVCKSLQKELS